MTYQIYIEKKSDDGRLESMLYGTNISYERVGETHYTVELSEEQASKWNKQFPWLACIKCE